MALTDSHSDTTALVHELQRAGLLPARGLIGGEWLAANDGATFAVTDPASGRSIGEVPRMGAVETRQAIDAAEAALPAWRSDRKSVV